MQVINKAYQYTNIKKKKKLYIYKTAASGNMFIHREFAN